ncbi:hypothetical protein HMPREF0208_04956 [Citrobacter koseri]|nr:hypothetical protein HMPREF0208_04956 [Citrobacter koseri]
MFWVTCLPGGAYAYRAYKRLVLGYLFARWRYAYRAYKNRAIL